jgi:hypothetical protein
VTFLAVAQAVVFAGALVVVVLHFARSMERQARAWTAERAELLTRIQHPERVQVPAVHWSRRPDRERDESHRVGRIEVR